MNIKKCALIYSSLKKDESGPLINEIEKIILEKNLELKLIKDFDLDNIEIQKNLSEIDFLIVLGGNGLFLRSISKIIKEDTLVLGVDFGRKGFLAEVSPKESIDFIKDILEGNYVIEKAMRLSIYLNNKKIGEALNEALLFSHTTGKLIEFKIDFNGNNLMQGFADGCIFSTPIGSTGYSCSAGGPIVDSHIKAIIITPICPLSNLKPIVVSSSKILEIEILNGEADIVIDGHLRYNIKKEEKISIKESEYPINFVRRKIEKSFIKRIEKRLRY
ncbi:MAG: NAD(+)/NADH kinase [Nitrososphaerota archaeon]